MKHTEKNSNTIRYITWIISIVCMTILLGVFVVGYKRVESKKQQRTEKMKLPYGHLVCVLGNVLVYRGLVYNDPCIECATKVIHGEYDKFKSNANCHLKKY